MRVRPPSAILNADDPKRAGRAALRRGAFFSVARIEVEVGDALTDQGVGPIGFDRMFERGDDFERPGGPDRRRASSARMSLRVGQSAAAAAERRRV